MLVAYAVIHDGLGLVDLLARNGFVIDAGALPGEVSDKTIDALNDPAFRAEFVKWFARKQPTRSGYLNDTGVTQTATGGFWSGVNAGQVLGFLGTGANLFGSIKVAETQANATKDSARAQIALAQAQNNANLTALELEKARLAAAQANPKKDNTLWYVLGGIGAFVLLGAAIYFATRNQGKTE